MNLTELPKEFYIGDTVKWTEGDAEYPAPTWEVRYYFTNKDGQFASAVSVDNGTDHDLTIDTSTIDEDGEYQYVRRVTDGTDTHTTEQGNVLVLPDLSADNAGVDRRSHAMKVLANIEAILEGKATRDQTSYSLNGRALSRYSPQELLDWRAAMRAEVATERRRARRKAGGKSQANVKASFSGSV